MKGLGLGLRLGLLGSTAISTPAWQIARRTAPAVPAPTGGTIYVSGTNPTSLPPGNDTTGNGTQLAPYATIEKALAVLPAGGNRYVSCDGDFSCNTSASGRLILNRAFTAPVVFQSYSRDPVHFTITNASGNNGVITCRSGASSNISFRWATVRSSTDSNQLFLSNPADVNSKGTAIGFFDCVMEARTQASTSITAVDLRTDFGITGLYFVRCLFRQVAGGSATFNPQLIRSSFLTQSAANQPHSDVGLWDCSTSGNWLNFSTSADGLTGIDKLTIVRCSTVMEGYALLVGKDDVGATIPAVTNVYIWDPNCTATGANGHGAVIGGGCTAANGEPTETSGVICGGGAFVSSLQGIVSKAVNALVEDNDIYCALVASVPSMLYSKGSTGTKFRLNRGILDAGAFSGYGFHEAANNSDKASGTELTDNIIIAIGAGAQALNWEGAAGSTGGANSNRNHIELRSGAALGSVRGTTVADQAALRAVWAAHGLPGDLPTNDSMSTVAATA